MDYSKMSDFEINCEVARAADLEGMMFFDVDSSFCAGPVWNVPSGVTEDGIKISRGNPFNPCNSPADAWPIITENNITIILESEGEPCALGEAAVGICFEMEFKHIWQGDNPLRNAMVVYLMMQEAK